MVIGTKTEQELINAFAGESQARNKYTIYSSIAKKEGYEQIAQIFTDTANNELQHAKMFYKHIPNGLKLVNGSYPFFFGTTIENLKSSFKGEKEEWIHVYHNAAEIAKEEGFKEISDLFMNVSEVEKHHSKRYARLFELMSEDKIFHKQEETLWICRKCGFIHKSKEALLECPLCKHPQAYQEILSETY